MTDDPNQLLPKIQQCETFVNEVLKNKLKYWKQKLQKSYLNIWLMVLSFLW